ncbi:hypothetical protein EV356DRAFT_447010 [Viridothelium virens]|uniref:T6SS Phospholipase effector Tle1-like catalytic domain-containing protein n=1 Tax=Viridothelium virens TaxID=1048519 RepID=A0A6A6H7Y6_VIRVR|nr:hypothetical protein EV356DRAFT_447010 [Viridothelium virens]
MCEVKKTGSYPIQSSEYTPHTSQSPVFPVEKNTSPLPKYIRAVKDSRESSISGRTVVVCLDGTGDKFDSDNSNVVHFVSCLKKHESAKQVTYYQAGIGTYGKGGLQNGIGAALDMAVGSGLGIHIKDAYKFLMQNYRDGDRICLFGFSRGAYTVRCLAGMLHKVGLLPASNGAQVNFAFKFYKDDTPEGWKMSAEFKKTFCTNVNVYFLGVWDCVASVGFIPRKLPFSKSPTNSIHHFRHAMALDEHRAKFKVCQWQQDDPDNPAYDTTRKEHHKVQTDVLEVWFMGAHADVGGGAVANECRHMLSRIPLRWMIRQCFECDTGILFDPASLAEQGLDIFSLWPTYQPSSNPSLGPPPSLMEKYETGTELTLQRRSTLLTDRSNSSPIKSTFASRDSGYQNLALLSESNEDHFDALSSVNDQLVEAKGWWVLEFWPIKVHLLTADGESWEKKVRMNMGRHRAIRQTEPIMHWTVKHMVDQGRYTVKGRVDRNTTWQVLT